MINVISEYMEAQQPQTREVGSKTCNIAQADTELYRNPGSFHPSSQPLPQLNYTSPRNPRGKSKYANDSQLTGLYEGRLRQCNNSEKSFKRATEDGTEKQWSKCRSSISKVLTTEGTDIRSFFSKCDGNQTIDSSFKVRVENIHREIRGLLVDKPATDVSKRVNEVAKTLQSTPSKQLKTGPAAKKVRRNSKSANPQTSVKPRRLPACLFKDVNEKCVNNVNSHQGDTKFVAVNTPADKGKGLQSPLGNNRLNLDHSRCDPTTIDVESARRIDHNNSVFREVLTRRVETTVEKEGYINTDSGLGNHYIEMAASTVIVDKEIDSLGEEELLKDAKTIEEMETKLVNMKEGSIEKMLFELKLDNKKESLKTRKAISAISSRTSQLGVEIQQLRNDHTALDTKVDTIQTTQITKVDTLKGTAKSVHMVSEKVNILQDVVQRQAEMIKNIEAREEAREINKRKCNIFITGIEESEAESEENVLELVNAFFSQKMRISENIVVASASRNGPGSPRSILVTL